MKYQRSTVVATAVGLALAAGSFGLAAENRAQQVEESRSTGTATSDAARELREAQQQVKQAGREVAEASTESREAVREGREAGRAAQQEARQESPQSRRYAEQPSQESSSSTSGSGSSGADRTRDAGAGTDAGSGSASDSSGDRTRTASAGSASAQSGSQGSASAPDAVWLFVPVAVSTRTEQQSQDCWVRLYSGENFQGRYITITGPAAISELRSPYGTGMNNWESAIVGRNAMVTTYDDDNFDDRSATLRGGERYPNLGDSKLGLFEDIESLRVTCGAPGQAGEGASSRASSNPAGHGGTSR